MSEKDKEKWNQKYASQDFITGKEPCKWLKNNAELLSGKGKALDIAMGEGRNAVFLASLGYDVLGLDISQNGIQKAQALARENQVALITQQVDLDTYEISKNSFDLIVCINFLDRKLFASIREALKPGGLVCYETFTVDYLKYSSFRREWVLEHNELLKEFESFRILKYQELDGEDKACASLIAQKHEG